jgi:DNA-binding transcriptional LysR family regulator
MSFVVDLVGAAQMCQTRGEPSTTDAAGDCSRLQIRRRRVDGFDVETGGRGIRLCDCLEILLRDHLVTLVAGGEFVGMLPASVAKFNTKRAGLKILPLKLPTVQVAASIVTVKNRTSGPAAGLFINCVRDVARSISAQPSSARG